MKTNLILLFLFVGSILSAQRVINIDMVLDDNRGSREFKALLETEIEDLIGHRYELVINEIIIPMDNRSTAESIITNALNSPSDLLISLGFKSSFLLSGLGPYVKPCIAGISLQRSENGSSGIDNFTFIESPFSIEKDLKKFKTIYDFKHLAVFIEAGLQPFIAPRFEQYRTDFDVQYINQSSDVAQDIAALNDDIDAVYYLPFSYDSNEKAQQLIDGINERKIASFSLLGRGVVENGALAALSSEENLQTYARRIAINTMKIVEGQNPKDFAVKLDGMQDDFVINVQTMKATEVYPPLEVLSEASLVKPGIYSGRELTIEGAIARALEQNINFQSLKKNIEIQDKEIGLAQSNILPQITASSSVVNIDGSSADLAALASQPTPQTEWAGNLQLTQVIYSEPALANIAVQKMLKEAQEAEVASNQLDLILDVSITYLNYLLALQNLEIQNENVEISKKNLNVAKNRVQIGARSQADVYGLEAQLAINKSDLNNAMNSVEQAKISLNTLLNYPLDEDLLLQDIDTMDHIVFVADNRLSDRIRNQQDIRKFNEYLINHAMSHLPALEQLNWNIKVQERLLKSNKRSNYLPQLNLQANVDRTLGRYGTKAPEEAFEAIGFDVFAPTYNVAAVVSFPIFQGNFRRKRIEQAKANLQQLALTNDNTRLQVESSIRSAVENLGTSYNEMLYARQSERASSLFLQNIQTLYAEGTTNINTLLDAQNNAIFAKLSATSALYNLIIDALILERSTGTMYLTSTEAERNKFISDFLALTYQQQK